MPLTAKKTGGSDFPAIEAPKAGMHDAICCWVVDLGTQKNTAYDIDQHKVLITWELPRETFEADGGVFVPKVLSKFYTLSLHQKANLRGDLESWRSEGFTEAELEGFDLKVILGKHCQVNVVHKKREDGSVRGHIAAILPPSPQGKALELTNDELFYSMEDGGAVPDGIPEWIVKIVHKSKEYNESGQQNEPPQEPPGGITPPPHDDKDVPF